MESAAIPHNENLRLAALRRYDLLDSEAEQAYDDITYLASQICDTPIALISLVDEHRQWFKSKVGLVASETPRELAFCAHAILGEGIFEIPDTLNDKRFHDNPLVTDQPNIRFYAGMPLTTPDGYRLGTLCAIDDQPHRLSDEQRRALAALARQLMTLFNLRLQNIELRRADEDKCKLISTLSHDLRSSFNGVLGYSRRLLKKSHSLESAQIEELSRKLLCSAERSYNQFNRVMEWASSQMTALKYNPVLVDLAPILSDVKDDLAEQARGKHIQIHVRIDEDVKVMVDRNMLYSVLLNLVSNAIKFTHEHGTIDLVASRSDDKIKVSVVDNGMGMSPDVLERFIAEGRLASTHGTLNENGTGLGLVLVREYLHYHDSKLGVHSSLGEGTEFWFLLNTDIVSKMD